MIVVVSPAKTLDFETEISDSHPGSEPEFLKTTEIIANTAKKLSSKEIEKLMKISPKLSDLNYERFQNFSAKKKKEMRPCAYAFKGDTYIGLGFEELSSSAKKYSQDHLRILSGLYGILRPYDLIMPYRLEMGTRLETSLGKNLYEAWRTTITNKLNQELSEKDFLINCASVEYFDAIDSSKLNAKIIDINFLEMRDGKAKVISFSAKRARGMMARFIVENKIKKPNELKKFNIDGYEFNEKLSKENVYTFVRG